MKSDSTKNISLVALFVAVLALGVTLFASDHTTTAKKESAYERVLRTGVLRCGWASWPPSVLIKDANTGKMSGALYDIVEEAGKNLNLKVEWLEETGWGNWIEGLKTNHFDAMCVPVFKNAARGREARFTVPLFYIATQAYARTDDMRFDNDIMAANNSAIRMSTMDGEMTQTIAEKFFPNAKTVSLPQLAGADQLLLNVVDGKADIVFLEESIVQGFLKQHPGTLRRVTKKPFAIFANSMPVAMNEVNLAEMLDSALIEMQNNGIIDQILNKHGLYKDAFMRSATPYQE